MGGADVIDTGAVITGIAEQPHGHSSHKRPDWFAANLLRTALADAGLGISDLDVVLTVDPRAADDLIHGSAVTEALGIHNCTAMTVIDGGAGTVAMLQLAKALIRSGNARHVGIVAADLPMARANQRGHIGKIASEKSPVDPILETPFGLNPPAAFALSAAEYFDERGADEECLADVAVTQRRFASLHPNAQRRDPIDRAQYYASPLIAEPLRRLDCSSPVDGGGACIVSDSGHSSAGSSGVPLLDAAVWNHHTYLGRSASLLNFGLSDRLDMLLERTRLDRSQLDLLLIYDCFSIVPLVILEDLGLAAPGKASLLFSDPAADRRSGPWVNTHGGLLSHGHPSRAAGVSNLIEAVVQLRGGAGGRQVPGCRRALVHGMGGVYATHGVALLGAAA